MGLDNTFFLRLLFALILIWLAACTEERATEIPLPTAPLSAITATPTLTSTPTSTPTITPTSTPTQTPVQQAQTSNKKQSSNSGSSNTNTSNTSSQQNNKPVSIQSFSTTTATVSINALQTGSARVPVSWHVINRPTGSNLSFDQLRTDDSLVNIELPRDNPYVGSSGSGIVAPILSGDNPTHITLILKVYDISTGAVYANSTIHITVQYPQENPDVVIEHFSTSATQVYATQLEQGTARVPVSWSVTNRPFNSNLVFEQLMADGTLENIELPRHVEIVSSEGEGVVAPIPSDDATNEITLVLRVIDLNTDESYAQVQFTLNVNDDPDEGVTIIDDCYGDKFLPSNNLEIGENAIVKFYPDSGGYHFVYSTRSGIGQVSSLLSEPLEILEGPFCFQRPNKTYPQRRWLIRYESGIQGWIDEYVRWDTDDYWVFIADSYNTKAQVKTFSVDKTSIKQGDSITVTWDVENTDHVAIRILNSLGENFITESGNNLPSSGSVEIDTDIIATMNSIELYYPPNLADMLVFEADCTYDVIDPDVLDYPTCPDAPQTKNASYQAFQYGYMIWQEDGIIATFTNDGANSGTFIDTYQAGDTLIYPSESPEGLIAPEHSFGKVWVNNTYLQNQLGWAIAPEQSYTITLQTMPGTIVYFTLPDGSYETYTTYGLYDE